MSGRGVCGCLSWVVAVAVCGSLAGCDNGTEPPSERRLVVEGRIDSGGYPEVYLTLSAAADEAGGSLSGNVVRWGVVRVSDGEEEVILTGGPKNGVFPPFSYYSFDMKGVAGKNYTLKADWDGMSVCSTVRMPEPTAIDEVRVERVAGSEEGRNLTLVFRSPDDCPAYYHVSTRVSGRDSRFYPSMPGAIAVTEGGKIVEMPVYKGRRLLGDADDNGMFVAGERVIVRLERVSADVFAFWRAWDNASLVEGSVFVGAPGSLPGNVAGGYGVWSAQGVDSADVEL